KEPHHRAKGAVLERGGIRSTSFWRSRPEAMSTFSATGGREPFSRPPTRDELTALFSLFRRRPAGSERLKTSAGRPIGLRHHTERGEGERMIGRRARLFADCHHRPPDARRTTSSKPTIRLVDDRQAGRRAARLDMLAAVAAEA